jgi:DDE superfamily endonuclease/Helix-turn-helix of DDE superfamily endonuclease
MHYIDYINNRKQFLALTSIEIEEFHYLLRHFAPLWEKYYRYHTTEGDRRKIVCYQEHKSAKLQGTAQKLFFLLVYLKNNPLQSFQAATFGVSQSKVSKTTATLLVILDETLKKMNLSPCRDGELLQTHLKAHGNPVFTYDGLERGIQRNTDKAAQEKEFSGKKKAHKVKNNVLCDGTQYVHYLSPSERGAVHDKKIADTYPIFLPQGSVLRQDTGFEGHRPKGVLIEQPVKKPKGKLLTFAQLIYNQMISAERVVIEHANSGIKRLRIVKDVIRFHASELRDTVIVVACALHNLRVISPYRDY